MLYRDEEGNPVLGEELRGCLAGLTKSGRVAAIAEINGVMSDAAAGRLLLGDGHLKKVARDPDLWELRWSMSGRLLRMYHAEPPELPSHLVALLVHWKELGKPGESPGERDTSIRVAQNAMIDLATKRYRVGWPHRWGIAAGRS